MAYTDKDAIYEIAEKLGYQGDEGLTTTEAVYAVASALGYTGEHDKSVALALSDLKTVVGGGGGGGSYGPSMVEYGLTFSAAPSVGNYPAVTWGAVKAYAGDSLVFEANPSKTYPTGVKFATGITVETQPFPDNFECGVYAATVSDNSYATVRQIEIEYTSHPTVIQGMSAQYWTFTIAEGDLEDGEFVVLYPHESA